MKAKVYNDNKYEYRENFKGEMIVIAPGNFVEMDFEDAIEFKSAFPNVIKPDFDGAGNQKPETFKMIRVEKGDYGEPAAAEEKFTCPQCGDELATEEALDRHIDKNHLDELMDQELADKRRKTKKAS